MERDVEGVGFRVGDARGERSLDADEARKIRASATDKEVENLAAGVETLLDSPSERHHEVISGK